MEALQAACKVNLFSCHFGHSSQGFVRPGLRNGPLVSHDLRRETISNVRNGNVTHLTGKTDQDILENPFVADVQDPFFLHLYRALLLYVVKKR